MSCYNRPMTTGSGLLEGLNPAQKEAVETVDGPLLIVAGPGSGKTRVITHRIAYLVREYEISPFNILAMTFTNKAAREMRERLDRLVGSRSDALTVGTFHSFCAKVLRIDGHNLGLDTNYSIYDADDQAKIIKDSMELAEIDPKRNPPRAILSMISNAKNKMWDSRTFTKNADNYFEEICAQVYHHYEEALTRNNAVDFDDLLMKTVQLLREFPGVRTKYNDRYKYIMVDEFQDTNISQYQLARLLAESHQNICVVGDPDQSIYSWRSADIRNILSFQGDYPQAKTIALDQNYRSTANILDAAKNLISINGQRIQKDLFTDNSKGDLVEIREAYDEGEEASFVISEAERLVRENGYKHGDCAVMYRINAQSRALEEACLHQGTRYRLVGGIRFYKRREVKDLMAYLHLVYNPNDDVNLGRVINVPPRGIGAKSMQQMGDWARSKNLGLFAAMQEVAAARLAGEDCPITITKKAATSFADFAVTLEKLIELSKREKVVDLVDRVVEKVVIKEVVSTVEVPQAAPITLQVSSDWTSGIRKKTFEYMKQEYEKLNPHVNVDLLFLGGGGGSTYVGYVGIVTNLMVAGSGPDVMAELWFRPEEYHIDLGPHLGERGLDKDDFWWIPDYLQDNNGAIRALPFGTYTSAFIANLNLFDAAGADVPSKGYGYPELRETAKQLRDPDKDQWGFERGTGPGWYGWADIMGGEGAKWYDPKSESSTLQIATAPNGNSVQAFSDWWGLVYKDGVAPNPAQQAAVMSSPRLSRQKLVIYL